MKHLEGKSCLLDINYKGTSLFFKALRVIEVSATHITFLDKFGKTYSFRLVDVIEATVLGENQPQN